VSRRLFERRHQREIRRCEAAGGHDPDLVRLQDGDAQGDDGRDGEDGVSHDGDYTRIRVLRVADADYGESAIPEGRARTRLSREATFAGVYLAET
jgi:hypothetical protein